MVSAMIGGHTLDTVEINGGATFRLFLHPVVVSWVETIVPTPVLVPQRTLVGQRTCLPNVSRETMAPAHAGVIYITGKRTC